MQQGSYITVLLRQRVYTDNRKDSVQTLSEVPCKHLQDSRLFMSTQVIHFRYSSRNPAELRRVVCLEHDILQAMVAWVENGTAPTQLTAAWYVDNNHNNGVGLTRPLCKVCVC
jgi:hypothetical protein